MCLVFTVTETNWDVSTSVYFSFVTLTTVGLGDVFPSQDSSRIFLVFFCMIGLGLLAAILTLGEELLRKLGKARKAALQKAREKNIARKAMAKRQRQGRKSQTIGRFSTLKLRVSDRVRNWKRKATSRGEAKANGVTPEKDLTVLGKTRAEEAEDRRQLNMSHTVV